MLNMATLLEPGSPNRQIYSPKLVNGVSLGELSD